MWRPPCTQVGKDVVEHVFRLSSGKDQDRVYDAFAKEIRDEPETLFVLIHDEACGDFGGTTLRRVSPHFLFYGIVSVSRGVPPCNHRKRLERLFKLMKLCEMMGGRHWGFTADGAHATFIRTVYKDQPNNLIKVAVSATPYNHLCAEFEADSKQEAQLKKARKVVEWETHNAESDKGSPCDYVGLAVRCVL